MGRWGAEDAWVPMATGAGPWAAVPGGAGRLCSHGNGGVPASVIGCWGVRWPGVCPPWGAGVPWGVPLCPQAPPRVSQGNSPKTRLGGRPPISRQVCPRSPGGGAGPAAEGCLPPAPRVFRQLGVWILPSAVKRGCSKRKQTALLWCLLPST